MIVDLIHHVPPCILDPEQFVIIAQAVAILPNDPGLGKGSRCNALVCSDNHILTGSNRRPRREAKIHTIHDSPTTHIHNRVPFIVELDKLTIPMPGRRLNHKLIDHHSGFAVRIVRRLPASLGRGIEIRRAIGEGCDMIPKALPVVAHRTPDHIIAVHEKRDSVIRKSHIKGKKPIGWYRPRYLGFVTKPSRSTQKISIEALDDVRRVVDLYPVNISIRVKMKLIDHESRHYRTVGITRKPSYPGTCSPAPVVIDPPL